MAVLKAALLGAAVAIVAWHVFVIVAWEAAKAVLRPALRLIGRWI